MHWPGGRAASGPPSGRAAGAGSACGGRTGRRAHPVSAPPPPWYCMVTWPASTPSSAAASGSKTSSTSWSSMKWLLGPIVANRMRESCLTRPGQLAPDAVGAAVGLGVEAAALLDSLERGRIDPEPVDGEVGALVGAADDLVRREVAAIASAGTEGARGPGRRSRRSRSAPGRSMSSATRAMPQFSEQQVNVGRIVSRVATAMLDGISLSSLRWKSGSTTAGAARSASCDAVARAPRAPPGRRATRRCRRCGRSAPSRCSGSETAMRRSRSCGNLHGVEQLGEACARRPAEREREAGQRARRRRRRRPPPAGATGRRRSRRRASPRTTSTAATRRPCRCS